MKVLVAHPGKQHSLVTARQLIKHGHDVTYITTLYNKKGSLTNLLTKLPIKGILKSKISNRKSVEIPDENVVQKLELGGLILVIANKIIKSSVIKSKLYRLIHSSFSRRVAEYAVNNKIDIVIMFDSNVYGGFRYIKKHGETNITCMLDATIASRVFSRNIYENEAMTNSFSEIMKEQKHLLNKSEMNRYRLEFEEADIILAPSNFVVESIKYTIGNDKKIKLLPYGVDKKIFNLVTSKEVVKEKLVLIYVGSVSWRKGLHILFEALKKFEGIIELKVVGTFNKRDNLYKVYKNQKNITFLGYKTQNEVAMLLASSDLFILPSLSEGMALVGIEALSSGVPLICTKNSGVNDLIIDWVNGICIEAGSVRDLSDILDLVVKNPDSVIEMRKYLEKWGHSYTWDNYGNSLNKIIENGFE